LNPIAKSAALLFFPHVCFPHLMHIRLLKRVRKALSDPSSIGELQEKVQTRPLRVSPLCFSDHSVMLAFSQGSEPAPAPRARSGSVVEAIQGATFLFSANFYKEIYCLKNHQCSLICCNFVH
jgi:hypothetical protein